MSRRLIRCISLSCLLIPAIVMAQQGAPGATVLDDARRLIGEGRAADAYRMLAAQELALAGQPLYDYLYGVAALDAGHADQAVGALARVVANDPDSASARLELGRAYYESGDRAAAQRQFGAVLARSPPPAIRSTAEAYLAAMRPSTARSSGWGGGYEFGSGYDSNANASTSDEVFLGVTLDPDNVETASAFLHLGGWLDHSLPVGEHSSLATTARVSQRWNENAGFVDQTLASLDTRLQLGDGPTTFSIGAGGYYGLLDGDAHRWGANLDVVLAHRFGEGWQAAGLVRAGQLRYDDDFPSLSVFDMDQLLGAFSLQRAVARGYFGVTVFAGNEDPEESGSAYGSDRIGAQLHAGVQSTDGNGIQLQFGWQDIDFDDSPGFFGGMDRADSVWNVGLTGEIRDWPAAGMALVPRFSWYLNDSNIALYEYDRFEFGLTLRRSFR